MYHPVHSSTSWSDTDPIYTEMSPLLKSLGQHSASNFQSNYNNPVRAAQATLMHISSWDAYVENTLAAAVTTRKLDASVIYLSVVTQYSQRHLVITRY